ncbi:hypothetical protein [Plastoroseomonas arctica]|uniref:Uncharacterized protein n=1 Tax=Plastoroseomonas arctica TaxID=1509237 RepID=A0AAF1JYS7_9PROT|nr:hypothetical protein [Plastoroseomonas arctica]MBR0655148.1 hypothetical protein [Plastoroseomonas arctica]
MFLHISKALFFSGLLAWSVHHLTGSDAVAGIAALGLLALRLANMIPFATSALPVLLGGLVLAKVVIGEAPVHEAMRMVQSRIQGVSVALAAPLDR